MFLVVRNRQRFINLCWFFHKRNSIFFLQEVYIFSYGCLNGKLLQILKTKGTDSWEKLGSTQLHMSSYQTSIEVTICWDDILLFWSFECRLKWNFKEKLKLYEIWKIISDGNIVSERLKCEEYQMMSGCSEICFIWKCDALGRLSSICEVIWLSIL